MLVLPLMLLSACAPADPGNGPPAPGRAEQVGSNGTPAFLLIRGRIGRDAVAIDPVLRADASTPAAPGERQPHRLTGFDDGGATLFTLRFGSTALSREAEEQHFNLAVPLPEEQAARLSRIELVAGDGRKAVRTASLSAEAFAAALQGDAVVSAERLASGMVRLRWDGRRFPVVMVREPETREVLAIGRNGEVSILTPRSVLEVTVSEGVRSGARQVRVP
jgi:hypothetical protein